MNRSSDQVVKSRIKDLISDYKPLPLYVLTWLIWKPRPVENVSENLEKERTILPWLFDIN